MISFDTTEHPLPQRRGCSVLISFFGIKQLTYTYKYDKMLTERYCILEIFMNKKRAKLILTFAQSNPNAKVTGEKLFMSSENVNYNLRKVQNQMGWDPRNFLICATSFGLLRRGCI